MKYLLILLFSFQANAITTDTFKHVREQLSLCLCNPDGSTDNSCSLEIYCPTPKTIQRALDSIKNKPVIIGGKPVPAVNGIPIINKP